MAEQRSRPRRLLKAPTTGRLSGPTLAADVPAAILDVSTAGVGLYLAQPVAPDSEVLLTTAAGGRTVALRLRYVLPGPCGGFLAGGGFKEELAEDELCAIFGSTRPACGRVEHPAGS